MKIIILAVVVAVIVEGLVSYGETIYDYFSKGDVKKAIKQIAAIALAVLFAFEVKVTLISSLVDVAINPIFDMIISGIFMSRGSNYLFDFVKAIRRAGRDAEGLDVVDDEDDEDILEYDDEDFDEDQAVLVADMELNEEADDGTSFEE